MAKRIASVFFESDLDPSFLHFMLLRSSAIYKMSVLDCWVHNPCLDTCLVFLNTKFLNHWFLYKAFLPSHTTANAACVVPQLSILFIIRTFSQLSSAAIPVQLHEDNSAFLNPVKDCMICLQFVLWSLPLLLFFWHSAWSPDLLWPMEHGQNWYMSLPTWELKSPSKFHQPLEFCIHYEKRILCVTTGFKEGQF